MCVKSSEKAMVHFDLCVCKVKAGKGFLNGMDLQLQLKDDLVLSWETDKL